MNGMKIYAYASMFVYLVFVGMAQTKHYKNQINRTLKESIKIEKRVEVKEQTSPFQTPKYQLIKPNIDWVDTFKTKPSSYKQHGGRPN
jgi:hypothetical protein